MTTLEQANKIKSLGSPLSIEQIIKVIEKKEAKSKKSSNKKWAKREKMEKESGKPNRFSGMDVNEMGAEISRGCLPSSMR